MEKKVRILQCKLSYKCSRTWDELVSTTDFNVRFCNHCHDKVKFIQSKEEISSILRTGQCFATNFTLEELNLLEVSITFATNDISDEPSAYDIFLEPNGQLNFNQLKTVQKLRHATENLLQLSRDFNGLPDKTLLRAKVPLHEADDFFRQAKTVNLRYSKQPNNDEEN